MIYVCSICKEEVNGDSLAYIKHTEGHIVDYIRTQHPEWEKEKGVCKKCHQYYIDELRGKSEK
ncbi:MAG: hypothetical protein P9X22_05545 [Candidatus Zapsychrus exili]|nr:hypothetical protein [Candidatus Zapsychrus exili]